MTASNLPREARALLDAIAQGESDPTAKREGISPYFILYGGGSFEGMAGRAGYAGFPAWSGKDNSHAAGRYQFEPATWLGIMMRFGPAIPNFRNPDDQDWGAWFLAQQDYAVRAGNLLADLKAGDTGGIGAVLQPTWTSLSDTTFPERYAAALANYPADAPAPPPAQTTPAPTPPPAPATADTATILGEIVLLWQTAATIAGYHHGPIYGIPDDATLASLGLYRAWIEAGRPR